METAQAHIVVIGSYAVGMTMVTDRFPNEGETVLGHSFRQLHGGKGSNQAIAASRLGAYVDFGGRIGNDSLGEGAINKLHEEEIGLEHLSIDPDEATGVGFVIVHENGENEIVIDFGANRNVNKDDIGRMNSLIQKADMVVLQLEINSEAVVEAVKIAKKNGTPVLLNPAPYQPVNDETLRNVTYLTPNETEAKSILGNDTSKDISDEEVIKRLYERYGVNVVMTRGSEGALYYNDSGNGYVPGFKVKAVDTTGAGDTFSAALSVGLSEKMKIEDAIRFANAAAAQSVQYEGVVSSIPSRSAVESFLNTQSQNAE